MLYYITLKRLSNDKHSSLLVAFVSYEENEVLWIWAIKLVTILTRKKLKLVGNTLAYFVSPSVTKVKNDFLRFPPAEDAVVDRRADRRPGVAQSFWNEKLRFIYTRDKIGEILRQGAILNLNLWGRKLLAIH